MARGMPRTARTRPSGDHLTRLDSTCISRTYSRSLPSFCGSNTTRVEIYVSFNPALNNTDFILEYEQSLSVSGDATTRTITAGATATAELYQTIRVRNKLQKISIGRYLMPAQITIVD